MKYLKKISAIAAIFLFIPAAITLRADKQNAILVRNKKGSVHHRIPSSQLITCTYEEDCIYLDFAEQEGLCQMTVSESNGEIILVRNFDSSALNISFEIGEYKIIDVIILTQLGNEYCVTLTQ
ncbi:MAG: hypothetical protein K2L21_07175 [Muribaculaceae bacterium]|nr:hypothetical protein [Muribaculaceae bacterium]